MKPCTECKQDKPLDDFYKNKSMADGRLNKCKVCFSAYQKKYCAENKEHLQQYKKEHRKEKADHYKEYAKSYRQKNIESIKEKEKERRGANSERIKEYERIYSKSENGMAVKKEIQKRYLSTAKGKALVKKSTKKYMDNNPIKIKCHAAVRRAIKSGRLIADEFCNSCNSNSEKLHGHHDDYSLPMSVRWLCAKCHVDWHKENGEGANAIAKKEIPAVSIAY